MRSLVRRVSRAEVRVNGCKTGEIGKGLLVYLGVEEGDGPADFQWLIHKILGMRIFDDGEGRMNESLSDREGIMLISQFTLFGNVKKGFRPSFNRAAQPDKAKAVFNESLVELKAQFKGEVASGVFGSHMDIDAIDDGPVSIWLDSRQKGY